MIRENRAREAAVSAGLRLLGRRLLERTTDIVQRTDAMRRSGTIELGPAAHSTVSQITCDATEAIALSLVGDGPAPARSVAQEAASVFGQLAIQRVAPLGELTKGALRWRDATCELLAEIAAAEQIDPAVVARAHAMVRRSADVTMVRLGEAFESERTLVDDELATRQRELVFMATHDPLTGLPNRTLILDRAEQLLVRSRREHRRCGALFVDLDGFKAVNDGLGHGAGDELLVAVAERLGAALPDADTLGRLGGDEFVVLVDGVALDGGPEAVAQRILTALAEPFALAGASNGRVALSASIGISLGAGGSAAELLRDADIAMYRAKLEGRNRFLVFEHGMQDAAHSRMELEMALRDAVGTDSFQLVYQPMLDLASLAPVRMEALLRWRREQAPAIGPDQFIPILEESGLISEVGRWVLAEACRRCAEWTSQGFDVGVAVNVSAVQLETDSFVHDVADALAASGLRPGALTIEITPTAQMRAAERTAAVLRAVKGLGVRLSIDDFGTGYSSLAYLQRFPVDELKIDRSFISQIEDTSQRDALIRTFVQLGRSLEIQTIAEGIEDHSQLERLQAERCDLGQGFLFARPMDGEQCSRFIRGSAAPPPADLGAALAA